MTTFSMLLGLFLAVFFVVFRGISKYRHTTMNRLNNEQYEIQNRHQSLRDQKREMERDIVNKEQTLAALKSTMGEFRGISVADLEAVESDENEKVGRYLLNQGKITREQHERALKKMDVLKMDYLGVCMALGFIDLETSKQALKAGKLTSTP